MCVCVCVRACVRARAHACVHACGWVGSQCARHGRFISADSVLGMVDLFRQPVC